MGGRWARAKRVHSTASCARQLGGALGTRHCGLCMQACAHTALSCAPRRVQVMAASRHADQLRRPVAATEERVEPLQKQQLRCTRDAWPSHRMERGGGGGQRLRTRHSTPRHAAARAHPPCQTVLAPAALPSAWRGPRAPAAPPPLPPLPAPGPALCQCPACSAARPGCCGAQQRVQAFGRVARAHWRRTQGALRTRHVQCTLGTHAWMAAAAPA